jgi:hypothetical protein
MITTTTAADLLAEAAEAETNAATQDAEAANMRAWADRERSSLAHARTALRAAHRKATRLDRPNGNAAGRAEEQRIATTLIPAIEARIADAEEGAAHYTADAARLRTVAADYRAQHAAETAAPVTVATPFAFIDWYVSYGTDQISDADADPTLTLARTTAATTPGSERVKITTSDPRILDGLTAAAEAFIADTRRCIENVAPDETALLARDIRITEKFKTRIQEARTELLAAAAAPQEAPQGFNPTDPATWAQTPDGYEWREIDTETGEHHLFAPDGTNLSAALPAPQGIHTTEAQQEAPRPRFTPQAPAQEAPTGPVLATWERELLAAAETPQGTPVTVEWTHSLHGHDNGRATLNGTTYQIVHITRARADRGALGDHLAYALTADGQRPTGHLARTWGLRDLLAQIATHAGITGPLDVTHTGHHRLTH